MKYALIGCGRVAPNHIVAAHKNKLNIVAVCDIEKKAIDELRNKYDILDGVKSYSDYKEMLSREQPELVAIATESGSHARIAVDCIEAGCNVIIEKPIALSLADADKIIEAATRKGVKVCANHQNRFNDSIKLIRSAVEEGRFGKIYHATSQIRWSRDRAYYEQAPWRGTWAHDGGTLMNQCIHNIDLLSWMLGDEPVEVMAMTDNLKHPYIEGEDLGLALIRFKNGAYGVVEGTTNLYNNDLEESLCIFGERGTVKATGMINNIIEAWNFDDGLDDPMLVKFKYSVDPPNVYGFGHTPLYADMLDAIENDRQPFVDMYAGRRAVELVLAIYKASMSRAAVSLPLDAKTSTTDFEKMKFGGKN